MPPLSDLPKIKHAHSSKVANLGIDFSSNDPKDYIAILSRVAEGIGAVPNMGVYADITHVHLHHTLRVKCTEHYLDVEVDEEESPRRSHKKTDGHTHIEQIELDSLIGRSNERHGILDGTIENHSCPTKEPCSECNGTGHCHSCDGKGKVKCPGCGGKGDKTCTLCKGKGYVACSTCGGSGKCRHCKGSGEQTCSRCEGSGWYQTYDTYTATRISKQFDWCSSDNYEKAIAKTEGRTVFNGRFRKWRKAGKLDYDHTERMRSAVVKAYDGTPQAIDQFLSDLEAASKNLKSIRYYSEAEVCYVPAVSIEFTLEQVQHSMMIFGYSGVVVYDSLPSRLEQYRTGLFKRIGMSFNRSNRHTEYIRLAVFFARLLQQRPEESRMVSAFVRALDLNERRTRKLYTELEVFNPKMDYVHLRRHIEHLLSTKRTLAFAWQCMNNGKLVNEASMILWRHLVAEFNVSETDIAALRRNAERCAMLSDKDLVEEYLRN